MRKDCAIDWLFVAALGLILVYQTLVGPVVGLANNGDFFRMMGSVGMTFAQDRDPGFHSFPRYYRLDPAKRYKCFPSSELLFVLLGLGFNRAVFGSGHFDLVSVGIMHSLAYLGAFAIFALALSRTGIRARWLLYLPVLFVFSDVAYVAYFNSLFAEPATLIFFCATIAFALLAIASAGTARATTWPLLGFAAASAAFLVAKLQNALLGPLLAIILYVLSRLYAGKGETGSPRIARAGAWLSAAVIVVSFAYWELYSMFPMGIRNINVYDSVFFEIVRFSPTPVHDLKELGLDRSYLCHRGTHAWSPGVDAALRADVYHKVGERRILKFYLRHPVRYLRLVWRAARFAFIERAGYLGNFETAALRKMLKEHDVRIRGPRESVDADSVNLLRFPRPYLTDSFGLYSSIKERLFGGRAWPAFVFAIINVAAVVVKLTKFDRSDRSRAVSILHACVLGMACVQFLTVTMGAGQLDIVKHFFLFNLTCDVALLFVVGYLLYLAVWLLGARYGQAPADN